MTKFFIYEQLHILNTLTYQKQSYANRYLIFGANGIQKLVIPVKKGKTLLTHNKVECSYEEAWRAQHLRSLKSAYGKCPFFDEYFAIFQEFYTNEFNFLIDWNRKSLELLVDLFKIDSNKLVFTDRECDEYLNIHPKKREKDSMFKAQEYMQTFSFKHGFKQNLSAVDLLFNEGPYASEILKKSVRT